MKLRGMENKIFNWLYDRVMPIKPERYLLAQGESLSDKLPYENVIEDDGREIIMLSDGAVGTLWELEPIPHEIYSLEDLSWLVDTISEVFSMYVSSRITFQIHFNQQPSEDFPKPDYGESPTFAQVAMKHRIKEIEKLAKNPGKRPALKRTRIFLSLRLECQKRFSLDSEIVDDPSSDIFQNMIHNIQESVSTIRNIADNIEQHFESKVKKELTRKPHGTLLYILRDRLHDMGLKQSSSFYKDESHEIKIGRISDNILNDSIEWNLDGIQVGNDLIEVLSWSSQPNKVYAGMMTELMKIKTPIDCVVNIRPNNYSGDIGHLANELKGGGDAKRERQKLEVKVTEDRMVYGEKLLSVSLHVLYRNVDVSLKDDKDLRYGQSFASKLSNNLMPLFVEKFAALPIFLSCMPLCYSPKVAGFIRRERRVLSKTVGYYLPLFSGSRGVSDFGQLMQARSGEAIWIDDRASNTNPHSAILGSSGGGKSFRVSNYLTSEFAKFPDLMVFVIDSITSYEIAARTLGEDHGFEFIKPPQNFPNLFKGEITEERLPTIIRVLNVAISLVSETKLTAPEKVLLSDAILKVYSDNKTFSKEEYIPSEDPSKLGEYKRIEGKIRLPRLSSVVDSFNGICEKKSIDTGVAESLREKLLPFYGSGPYSLLFDQLAYAEEGRPAPGFSLYDLEHLKGDPILNTITALIIIAEIEREIANPLNKGRFGCLIIDEAGENLKGDSKELESFVDKAFTTFRKKDIVCKVLTNQANHYIKLPALKAAWSLSANKEILPLEKDEIPTIRQAELLSKPYYYELVQSLIKVDGAFSEALYLGNAFSGSYAFVPTGYDYWLAANKNHDVGNVELVKNSVGSYQKAITLLALSYPMGVRNKKGKLRGLTGEELEGIVGGDILGLRKGATSREKTQEAL